MFQVLTKDAVTVAVDAVMVYKIVDPMSAITQFEDPMYVNNVPIHAFLFRAKPQEKTSI